MAHVTTPRWLSPVSRRIVVIVIAAAAALMLLTSILITSASAADPIRVRNVQGDACQSTRLGVDAFGVDAFEVVIPRGDVDANYSRKFDLPNGGELTLSAPPNRAFVAFSMTGATADGGILFNRTDQKDGNLYDYRPEGGVTAGRLEPPPRDQGNEKQVVFCFAVAPAISIDVTTSGSGEGPGDEIFIEAGAAVTWTYTVTNTGDVPLENVTVTDSELGVTPVLSSGDTNGNSQLDLTETWVWTATGAAEISPIGSRYTNTGTVTAFFGLVEVSASDVSSYFGATKGIAIVKTTNGSDPTDEDPNYIKAGTKVTWQYVVTNEGNVALTGVTVRDSDEDLAITGPLGDANGNSQLDPTETWVYEATLDEAVEGTYSNTGYVSASGSPIGPVDEVSDDSGYFGATTGLIFKVIEPNGVVIVTGETFTRTFTVENSGNVPLEAVIVSEDGTVCDEWFIDGEGGPLNVGDTIPPGTEATCSTEITAVEGAQSSTYSLAGLGPFGQVPDEAALSDPIEYFGGLDCGATIRSVDTDDLVGDGPDVGFWAGLVSETLNCGTAVEVNVYLGGTDEAPVQVAEIVAPAGYPFTGTGVVTINWDAIPRDDDPLVRTVQEVTGGTDVIEQCAVIVPIKPGLGGDYELVSPEALYPLATDFDKDGEYSTNESICLIQQFNYQVDVSGEVYMQLQEVYYVWNDPILIRPR